MSNWSEPFIPTKTGQGPEGVSIETHDIRLVYDDGSLCDGVWGGEPMWAKGLKYRYLPRNPPATYEQVVAWCKANGRDVPAPPVDYEAWRPVLDAFEGWKAETPLDEADKTKIDEWIRAFKLAMTIPACREAIKE